MYYVLALVNSALCLYSLSGKARSVGRRDGKKGQLGCYAPGSPTFLHFALSDVLTDAQNRALTSLRKCVITDDQLPGWSTVKGLGGDKRPRYEKMAARVPAPDAPRKAMSKIRRKRVGRGVAICKKRIGALQKVISSKSASHEDKEAAKAEVTRLNRRYKALRDKVA